MRFLGYVVLGGVVGWVVTWLWMRKVTKDYI